MPHLTQNIIEKGYIQIKRLHTEQILLKYNREIVKYSCQIIIDDETENPRNIKYVSLRRS